MSDHGCVLSILSDSGDESDFYDEEVESQAAQQPQRSPTFAELRVTIREGKKVQPFYESLLALKFVKERLHRGFIVERQFNGVPGTYQHQFHLDVLIEPPTFAKMSLVKEFYGNLSQSRNDSVYVRGFQIENTEEKWDEKV